MQRNLSISYNLLSSGNFKTKGQPKKSGYANSLTKADMPLSAGEITNLTTFPNDIELDALAKEAWEECVAMWDVVGVKVTKRLSSKEVSNYRNNIASAAGDENYDTVEDDVAETGEGGEEDSPDPTQDELMPLVAREAKLSEDLDAEYEQMVNSVEELDINPDSLTTQDFITDVPERAGFLPQVNNRGSKPMSIQSLLNLATEDNKEEPEAIATTDYTLLEEGSLSLEKVVAVRRLTFRSTKVCLLPLPI